jgi:filamentous hemagglutinin family protein
MQCNTAYAQNKEKTLSQYSRAIIAYSDNTIFRIKFRFYLLAFGILLLLPNPAKAGPAGGEVTSGSGNVNQSGSTVTITQASQNISLNWQSFNVATNETVNFIQPSASAIAVNRIYDTNGSKILGQLNANGQIYLINPNGILFGQGARVNVGGLVASALEFNNTSLNTTKQLFSGNGSGQIINQGSINASSGGYVALLGNTVSNEGSITVHQGTVALGAGNAATLTFLDNSLVKMQIDQSVLNSLSQNSGLIHADGGLVIMNAGAKNALLASVVNNTGIIEAHTVAEHEGSIILLGGMAAGTTEVGGTLDASAPDGGNGGFIETSATHVKIADDAVITTAAPTGKTGTWLIDPVDFTISASRVGTVSDTGTPSGDISGVTLSSALSAGNVTILSTQGSGPESGLGDINVNDTVSWSANQLTLSAAHSINVNAVMTASGTSSLALITATPAAGGAVNMGFNTDGTFKGRVDFPGRSGTGIADVPLLTINTIPYTVINALGVPGDAITTPSVTTLQGMATSDISGHYVLGSNIDASATTEWNSNAGFTPIGQIGTLFIGTFNGLGHTISNLFINRATTSSNNIGLFGGVGTASIISNVGLIGGSISGYNSVGSLMGSNTGTVSNCFATSNVNGFSSVGGLMGSSTTKTVSNSHATGNVTGTSSSIGGLMGSNTGTVINSYATGNVTGTSSVGGLMGSSTTNLVSNSYATGNVTGTSSSIGGLMGTSSFAVNNSYASGNVSGTSSVGGLIGTSSGTVSNAYATGYATGTSDVGGLIGTSSGAVSYTYAVGAVSGTTAGIIGALIGTNSAALTNSYWNKETATIKNAVGTGGELGTGLTSSQMKKIVNFPNWDISNVDGSTIWRIYEDSSMPLLRTLMQPITVTAVNATKTYDALAYSGGNGVTYSVAPTGLVVSGLMYTYSNPSPLNAGSYSITPGGILSTQQYLVTFADGTLAITTAPLTITATNDSKTYGDVKTWGSGLTAFTPSALQNSETIGSVTITDTNSGGVVGANAGSSYALTPGAATGGTFSASNYAITYTAGALTINPALLTVSGSRAYNGLTSISGSVLTAIGVNGETFSIAGSGDTSNLLSKDVQTGSTLASLTGLTLGSSSNNGLASNYNVLSTTLSSVTIGKANATVTVLANSGTGTYSGIEQSVTGFTTTGLVNNETASVLTNVSATGKGTDANTYSVVASGSDTNYNLTFTDGTLTIGKANLTLSGNRAYDGLTSISGSMLTATGVHSETFSIAGSGDTSNLLSKDVQTGSTLASLTGLTLGTGSSGGLADNYNALSVMGSSLTIGEKAITITGLKASSKVYDATTAATLTGTATGWISGDDVTVSATGLFATKDVGTGKTVTLSSTYGGEDLANYTITDQATTTADITAKAITITGLTANKVYDALLTTTLTGTAAGWIVGDDVTVSATGLFESKGVGTDKTVTLTSIYGGADLANYTITNPTTTTANISRASTTVTVLANSGTVTYNALEQSLTGFTATGLLNNDVLTGVSATGSGTNAGSYSVLASGSDMNYNLTFTDGTLTITPALLTIHANNASKIAGALNPELTGWVDGFVGTDNLANATSGSVQYITTATTASMEGAYNITVLSFPVTLYGNYTFNDIDAVMTVTASIPPPPADFGLLPSLASNYNLTFADGTLPIAKANDTVSVIANNGNVTYTAVLESLTEFKATDLLNIESNSILTGVSASGSGTNAGTYRVVAARSDSNFNLIFTDDGMLTVSKAKLMRRGLTVTDLLYNTLMYGPLGGSASITKRAKMR